MKTSKSDRTRFASDILAGLRGNPKTLSSKYFYDEAGDKLFQQIMEMPEYYLTRSEWKIFQTHRQNLLEKWEGQAFDLIELGAGDGTKTKILLHHFLEAGINFRYLPIDISTHALEALTQDLAREMPRLPVEGLQGDYFSVLEHLSKDKSRKKVVLFLGSNIGNFKQQEAKHFLRSLCEVISPGDQVLIGFDLKKNPATILAAYNDPTGITAAFNLNLLKRINRELKGNFDLEAFLHWETYNPLTGAAQSFLVSKKDQEVYLESEDTTIHFDAWEPISVELSQKFSLREIEFLSQYTGFRLIHNYLDSKGYFVDSLWEKV